MSVVGVRMCIDEHGVRHVVGMMGMPWCIEMEIVEVGPAEYPTCVICANRLTPLMITMLEGIQKFGGRA